MANAVSAQMKSAENASRLIEDGDIVMTCSYSSTVVEAFRITAENGRSFKVVAAESKFGSRIYGKLMAKKLKQRGITVHIIPDSSISNRILKVDKVLAGADSILRDGSLINGTPTLAIAKAAIKLKPFYTVCETLKFNPLPLHAKPNLEDGLEWIQAEMITAIVTERGVLTPSEAAAYIKDMEKYAKAIV